MVHSQYRTAVIRNDIHKRCWLKLDNSKYAVTVSGKFDITYDRKLTDKVINFGQQILKLQFPDVNGLQDCCYVPVIDDGIWKYSLRMKHIVMPACQIHHTGSDLWVTSILPETCDEIIIFDSLQGTFPTISNSLKLQLFAVYGSNKKNLTSLPMAKLRGKIEHSWTRFGVSLGKGRRWLEIAAYFGTILFESKWVEDNIGKRKRKPSKTPSRQKAKSTVQSQPSPVEENSDESPKRSWKNQRPHRPVTLPEPSRPIARNRSR